MKNWIAILGILGSLNGSAKACERDAEGLTPLLKAAARGQVEEVKKWIEAGADLYALDSRMGYSVLHKAVYSGNPEVVRYLIEKGALVNLQTPGNGDTPLLDALYFKKKAHGREVIELLLKAGSSLSVRSRAGFTPLEAATLLNDQEAVQQIKAEMDRRYSTQGKALMSAVKNKDAELTQHLLGDPKTPLNEIDPDGFTPLLWASREGFADIVSTLLLRGADPNQLDTWMGANAAHKAAYWGRTDVMKILVKSKIDLNARGLSNGYTPLHDAVSGNHYETAKVLVDAGVRTDIEGHDGLRPLDIAKANENSPLVELLSRGENITPQVLPQTSN